MRVESPYLRLAVAAAAALTLFFLAGARSQAKPEAGNGTDTLGVHAAAHCFRHVLRLGMTRRQALESDWCLPNDIERSTNAPGAIEYWFYGERNRRTGAHTGMILFDHGVVTYFSDKRRN